jgi:hypothetical protein
LVLVFRWWQEGLRRRDSEHECFFGRQVFGQAAEDVAYAVDVEASVDWVVGQAGGLLAAEGEVEEG